MAISYKKYEKVINKLKIDLKKALTEIETIKIGSKKQFPYGWRNSAKGRSIWRIVEESIIQQLEQKSEGKKSTYKQAESEVGIYDFSCKLYGIKDTVYVNIKTARPEELKEDGSHSKVDISKAKKILDFFNKNKNFYLITATVETTFNNNMSVSLGKISLMPTAWLADIYVNPSNNGNIQSKFCKNENSSIKRTHQKFKECLSNAINLSQKSKKNSKRKD